MPDHHLARFDHFDELVLVRVMLAVRAMHDKRPPAARLELEDMESVGKPGRAPPCRELDGVAEGLEDRFRRGGD